MEIINIIELIAESGNRGKELLIDSFVLGIAWGRKMINTIQEIKQATQYLYQLNQEVELSQKSPFQKLDLFQQFLIDENFQLFPDENANKKKQFKGEIKQNPEINQKQEVDVNKLELNQSICGICKFYINDLEDEKCKINKCGHEFHNLCLYQKIDQQNLQTCYICQIQLEPNIKTQILKKISTSFKSCCPNPECDEEFIYFGQLKYMCKKCNIVCCLKCKQVEHDDQCKVGIDYIDMKQGQKFKFCFHCLQSTVLNFYENSTHQCQYQDKNQFKRSQKIFNFVQHIWHKVKK
ncbi:unnamed protein product [Paramecium pentaurelia]|uniref:RING-type domain-containing protein n=1 Tax=Paramecium pentaurelia TaxID=43138 RepID=A0A8S1WJ48_9CILI|nr:unnamed protein product [Paramecium pentaurelia]